VRLQVYHWLHGHFPQCWQKLAKKGERQVKRIMLEVDDLDFDAIQNAICRRQSFRCMPDGDGNTTGRVVAEICRGWSEMLDAARGDDDKSGEQWKQ
jgi:hypothetical protein